MVQSELWGHRERLNHSIKRRAGNREKLRHSTYKAQVQGTRALYSPTIFMGWRGT